MSMSTLPIHPKSGREQRPVGARTGHEVEINVTPLIDILLVLLIIFMVILPQHELGELAQIPLPNPDKQLPNPNEPIVIQLKTLARASAPSYRSTSSRSTGLSFRRDCK